MFISPCKRKQNYWPTTPNIIVGRHVQRPFEHPVACYCMLRQQWWELLRASAVACKRMQQLPTMLGPVVHRGKDTTHKSL